nr:MAG TPA: hypothetical protein [Bacteriophage sp.]
MNASQHWAPRTGSEKELPQETRIKALWSS